MKVIFFIILHSYFATLSCLASKRSCKTCNKQCKFKIVDKMNKKEITLNKVKAELKVHGHPYCRKINKIQRTLVQAKNELIDHYKFCHFIQTK